MLSGAEDEAISKGRRIRFDFLLFIRWDGFFGIDKHALRSLWLR
jgi:hypothetical protein